MPIYSQPAINIREESTTSLTELFIDLVPKRLPFVQQQSSAGTLAENDIKVLLLENTFQELIEIFKQQGYQVEQYNYSLTDTKLISRIENVLILDIGPKTHLSANILGHAKILIGIGCFSVEVSNVDLEYATRMGVAVFHPPFLNSRSVVELVIGNIINLPRQVSDKSQELHNGIWKSSYKHCWEIRENVLGILEVMVILARKSQYWQKQLV